MDNNFQQQINGKSDLRQEIADKNKLLQIVMVCLSLITISTILQDFIHSRLNNYSFYLSESLLFKTVWILFLPLLFLQYKILEKFKLKTLIRNVSAVTIPALIHLLLVPLMIFTISAIFYSHIYSYLQTLNYTIAEESYKLLLIYGLSAFLYKYIVAEEQKENSEKADFPQTALKNITVSNGRKYTPISVGDIFYFTAESPYLAIRLADKRYLHNETLKSINEKLDKMKFVRVHKSTIVNLEKIVSYKSRLNGDYDLRLENGDEIRLSRTYRAEFKRRFKTRPQVRQ